MESLIGPVQAFSLRLILAMAWLPILFQSPLHAEVQDVPPIGRHYDLAVITEMQPPEDTYQMGQGVVVDIDGDGGDDVIFFGHTPGVGQGYDTDPQPLYIMVRNSDGVLENRVDDLLNGPRIVLEGGVNRIMPADFNGDGRTDLFLEISGTEIDGINDPGGQNRLLLMGSDGKLTDVTSTHLPQYSDKSHYSTLGDFDGDGDVDIFVNLLCGGGPDRARECPGDSGYLMFNDGTGHFTIVADFGGSGPNTVVGPNGRLPDDVSFQHHWALISVDADGDGDLDIYLGQTTEVDFCPEYPNCDRRQKRVILINDGSGRFSKGPDDVTPGLGPVGTGPEFAIRSSNSRVYDINNDGLDDLVLQQLDGPASDSGEDANFLQILISNGDGTFNDETDDRHPNDYVNIRSEVYLHDLDDDGNKDIFTTVNRTLNDIRINDGEGNFRPLREDWITFVGSDFSRVIDVDGDGDVDFVDMDGSHWVSKMILPYGAELDGFQNDDHFVGGAHDNIFRGYFGDDHLDGGLGNDWLSGGPDDDTLIGGKGNDGYAWLVSDLAGHDQLSDKLGQDRLRFIGFGLEKVSSASQDESGGLLVQFTAGGSVLVERHFSDTNYRVEFLQTDDCTYRISNDPAFVNGDITELLGDCILHMSGFENLAVEPDFTDPCDIGTGTWAVEARNCTVEDCTTYDEARYLSWDRKVWCRALHTDIESSWILSVPEGASTLDFWADWGGWGFSDYATCGDGEAGVNIEACGLNHAVHRFGEEQHLTCDVTGETSITISQIGTYEGCDMVIIGDPFFY